jgi:hypothetical protein
MLNKRQWIVFTSNYLLFVLIVLKSYCQEHNGYLRMKCENYNIIRV